MKKLSNYDLEIGDGAVIIYRTDRNIGRIAVVFKDSIRFETSHRLPNYILNKAKGMLLPENTIVLKKQINCAFGGVTFPCNTPLLATQIGDGVTIVSHPQRTVISTQVTFKNILYHNCEWLKESFKY